MKEKNETLSSKLINNSKEIVSKSSNIKHCFPVAGIVASAEGLKAFELFFKKVPEKSGISFIVIQHQDLSKEIILPELLQKITTIEVHWVTDGTKIKPNAIYVIPSNKSLSILNGTLLLFDAIESASHRLPLDVFFRSLAADQKQNSIAILLSDIGFDGNLGIKSIKENNGIVVSQEPSSENSYNLPHYISESVNADIIAPVEELPIKLLNLITNRTDYLKEKPEKNFERSIGKIISLLRQNSGNDFSMYKKSTFLRRIERRKEVHQIKTLKNYVLFMEENPQECEILFKELLIGVTSFFRDSEVWEQLENLALLNSIQKFEDGYMMRAWVTGCSTGEEAYSLAITFSEIMEKHLPNKKINLQIFATDLDKESIEKARKGLFSSNIKLDISSERLEKYFNIEGNRFRINNTIREMIIFATQNVTKDPPFTKLDFISCRNMLIYMESELQKRLLKIFNYSLNSDGVLLLGTSETIGNNNIGFKEIDSKNKIFKKKLSVQVSELIDFPSTINFSKIVKTEKKNTQKPIENVQSMVDQFLLNRFVPPSVLVNEKGDILYISGKTGKYLEPVAGKANWNIHSMAREGLSNELLDAFHNALKHYKPVLVKNIKINVNESIQYLNLLVQKIENPIAIKDNIMIVFIDNHNYSNENIVHEKSVSSSSSSKQKELEIELRRCQAELQNTQEAIQTSQEELISTNEELQSTNEELQSTNEELTTSKEEMQSLNEELQTVNSELQIKVSEYIRSNDDMTNLLNSSEVATLFIDRELNIRKFTDQVTKIFKIRKTDIGRPFTDLVTDLIYPAIEKDSKAVIKSLVFIENAIETNDGRWFNVRIMPYRTIDDYIDGLVLTFSDITTFKNLEAKLIDSEERFKISLQNTPISVFNQDKNLLYTWIHNPFLNLKPNEIIGKKDEELLPEEYATKLKKIKKEVLSTGIGVNTQIELIMNKAKFSYTLIIDSLKDKNGNIVGITGITWDNYEQKNKKIE